MIHPPSPRGKELAPVLLFLPFAPVAEIQKHRVQFVGIHADGVPTYVEVPRFRFICDETPIQENDRASCHAQRIQRSAKSQGGANQPLGRL